MPGCSLRGQDITAPKTDIQKIRKGYRRQVSKDFNLFPHMTVMENMVYAPIRVNRMPKDQAKEKALELLKSVGLTEKADVYPGKLSRRTEAAYCHCAGRPWSQKIMLFDEPTRRIWIRRMVKRGSEVIKGPAHTGITMALVTHGMGFTRKSPTASASSITGRSWRTPTRLNSFQTRRASVQAGTSSRRCCRSYCRRRTAVRTKIRTAVLA